MANKKRKIIQKRRKREGKTNYKKRLKLLLSSRCRLVVRPSLNSLLAQIIEYAPKGDKVLVAANANELDKFGCKFNKGNPPSAYLTGFLLGTKCAQKGIKDAVLDIGLKDSTKGSRIFACLKGTVDAKLNVPCSKEVFPSEDRIKGEHIVKYASIAAKRFTKQNKEADVKSLPKSFEDVKNKIAKVK